MDDLVLRNANLGLTMHRVNWNGEETVWGDDMKDSLFWERTDKMIRCLKEGVEYYKVLISDLKSKGWNLPKFGQVKKNTLYAYLITKQGVMKLIATRRPHDVEGNNKWLSERLDKLQDWIFGEVLPEVLEHGVYVSKAVAMAPEEIRDKAIMDAIDRAVESRLSEIMPRLELKQWQINNGKTAKAMQTASVLSRKNHRLEAENSTLKSENSTLKLELENKTKAVTYLEACLKDKCSHKKKNDGKELL